MDDKLRLELNKAEREGTRQTHMAWGGLELPGMYFDKDGVPIGLGDWAALFEDFAYRIVGRDMVGPHLVSTVWLGTNHAFMPGVPPIIFETMVVRDESHAETGGWWDLQHRYSTLEQAQAGHERVVAHVEALTGVTRAP